MVCLIAVPRTEIMTELPMCFITTDSVSCEMENYEDWDSWKKDFQPAEGEC